MPLPGVSREITQDSALVTVFMIRSYVAYQSPVLAPERILWDREGITLRYSLHFGTVRDFWDREGKGTFRHLLCLISHQSGTLRHFWDREGFLGP